jgi:hypothetical protein
MLGFFYGIKETGFQSYCDTIYSRGGVNQMWILKNSKDLLEYIQSRSISIYNIIKTFDFYTLYTTIPLTELIKDLAQLCFIRKDG